MFRSERAIRFVVMVTPEDLKANAGKGWHVLILSMNYIVVFVTLFVIVMLYTFNSSLVVKDKLFFCLPRTV